jgi:thiamine biosynthesis lipoprotein
MGLDKAKEFLATHPELQAYLIYSDDKGNYQVYETEGLKAILIEAEEQK